MLPSHSLVFKAVALYISVVLAYLVSTISHNLTKYYLFYGEFETQKITVADLRVGDHIFIPGSQSEGLKMKGLVGYYHHGVYLGAINGEKMITDFGAVNKERPVIRKFEDFLGSYSNQLYRRNYRDTSKLLPPEKIVEYAKLICNGHHSWPPYSVNTNNCEHYASLLKIEKLYSSQAQHLPQDWYYRRVVVPVQEKTILIKHRY